MNRLKFDSLLMAIWSVFRILDGPRREYYHDDPQPKINSDRPFPLLSWPEESPKDFPPNFTLPWTHSDPYRRQYRLAADFRPRFITRTPPFLFLDIETLR
jgi:hypothetical protein